MQRLREDIYKLEDVCRVWGPKQDWLPTAFHNLSMGPASDDAFIFDHMMIDDIEDDVGSAPKGSTDRNGWQIERRIDSALWTTLVN